jgi:hypothetical protein
VWDHRHGAPKREPTVGEDRVPVDSAANANDRARLDDSHDVDTVEVAPAATDAPAASAPNGQGVRRPGASRRA